MAHCKFRVIEIFEDRKVFCNEEFEITKGGKVREETVNGVLDRISLGNQNMRLVLGMIYTAGKECIDVWPEDKTGLMSRRMLRVAGILIRQRINPEEVGLMGRNYWQGEEGKKVDAALVSFIETRRNKRAGERKKIKPRN